jgi:hypothetical protein
VIGDDEPAVVSGEDGGDDDLIIDEDGAETAGGNPDFTLDEFSRNLRAL